MPRGRKDPAATRPLRPAVPCANRGRAAPDPRGTRPCRDGAPGASVAACSGRLTRPSLTANVRRSDALVRAEKTLAVEVDQMVWSIGTPGVGLPRYLGQVLAHLGTRREATHED